MKTIQTIIQTVDASTGEVQDTRAMTWGIMLASIGLCPICGADHETELPHNAQSLYYQMAFKGSQGRWPTWADALAHCSEEMRGVWKTALSEKGVWSEPSEGLEPIAHFGKSQPIKKESDNEPSN